MRCKDCDYPLWNLATRNCPECGAAFLPSDYPFAPNSVQFKCPHCGQAYYGNDSSGHLVPRAFNCATCGNPVNMDEMVISPAEGVTEEQATVGRLPWVERERTGTIKAWFAMVGLALFKPPILGRAIPMQSSVAGAFWFAILTQLIISLVSAAPMLLFVGVMALATARSTAPRGAGPAPALGMSFAFGMIYVVGFALCVIGLALWGLVAHGLLRITGPRGAGGLGATYRALCYSSAANAASAVPCIGGYFGWIWWLVSAVITFKEHQRIRAGRAALCILTFPVLVFLAIVGGYAGLIFFAMSAASRAASASATTAGAPPPWAYPGMPGQDGAARMTQIALSMKMFEVDNGRPAAHGLELVDNAVLTLDQLIAPGSATTLDVSMAGGTALDKFRFMPPSESRLVVQNAIAALPSGVVAHRVADVVFTFHGIDTLADPPGGLWVAVMSPDPDLNPAPQTGDIFVALHSGRPRMIPRADFAAALTEQNGLRASAGLPPIPDPSTVTSRVPAVAPGTPPAGAPAQPAQPPG